MAKELFHQEGYLTNNPSNFFRKYKTLLTALVAVSVFLGWMLPTIIWSPLDAPKEIVVKEGDGAYAIADTLKTEGVISNKFVFIAYVLITGNEKKLQAGRYLFKPGDTIIGIVHSIANGLSESDDIVVTIPEGFNVWEIDKKLASFGLILEGEFAKKYQPQEGEFFPDTYRFNKKLVKTAPTSEVGAPTPDATVGAGGSVGVDTIAERMVNNHSSLVSRETLIRASILEKEAHKEEDMQLVAGVIKNRLDLGMLLQIDATVSYGACLRNLQLTTNNQRLYKYCDVSQIGVGLEIKIDGPYNSYMRAGLPPGPIANPGTTAIRAVLNPKASDYLYYLSTRDGSQIIFSKTAAEHAANRRKYLGI